MRAEGVTVGVPVRDLDRALAWYQRAFELGDPQMTLVDGLVEFDLGPFWLQLLLAPDTAGGDGLSLNVSVQDVRIEHRRLTGLGLSVSEIAHFEGVVDFFELTDLDGNKIGFVTELT